MTESNGYVLDHFKKSILKRAVNFKNGYIKGILHFLLISSENIKRANHVTKTYRWSVL